jgi:hypothetical protein
MLSVDALSSLARQIARRRLLRAGHGIAKVV